jgi:hypothetical protein
VPTVIVPALLRFPLLIRICPLCNERIPVLAFEVRVASALALVFVFKISAAAPVRVMVAAFVTTEFCTPSVPATT